VKQLDESTLNVTRRRGREETEVSKVLRSEKDVEKVQLVGGDERGERKPGAERLPEEPLVLDEICVEELAIDGICGVY
jgi:mycofactocin precursor